MANQPLLDRTIFESINAAEKKIENILDCDLLYFYGEIRHNVFQYFRNCIEALADRRSRKQRLTICLKTPGGVAETVEKMVEVARNFYGSLYFVVPDEAMSAGTIFCMAGDKIYMDYSSSLGPIDPQVPDKENRYLVPALGYLDKIQAIIDKSRDGTISPVEFAIVEKQDLAMLSYYEHARDLSIALLEKWLTTYKFKDWETHRTTNPGTPVTDEEKRLRAIAVAEMLSDNKHWHSHGRMIGIHTLRSHLRLEIDDFGQDVTLQRNIRRYNDALSDYLGRAGVAFFLHNRHINKAA